MRIINVKREYKTTALAESETNPGSFYQLNFENGLFTCTCPSHTKGGRECKHIQAFKEELEYMKQQRNDDIDAKLQSLKERQAELEKLQKERVEARKKAQGEQ